MFIGETFEKIIKLNKRINELEFKMKYLENIGKENEYLELEKKELEKERDRLIEELEKRGIEFFVPFEKEIKRFEEELGRYSFEQINLALKKKQGSAWELLNARAVLSKRNVFHSRIIGKIAELLMMVEPEKRNRIIEFIRSGKVDQIEVGEEGARLAKYLNRVGIKANYKNGLLYEGEFPLKEVAIEIDKDIVYVPKEVEGEVLKLKKDLGDISIKIQLMNAERKIRRFSPEEEKEFEELQKRYLGLLKKKKEILEKYKD